jgi:multicomponent Na+:H+ antiporter subunit E
MPSKSPPYVVTFVISLFLWLLFTASFDTEKIINGLIISLAVSWITAPRMMILHGLNIHPGMFWALLKYLAYFFKALIKANFDLAGRVLSKNINIHPDFVEIETSMQSDLGKLLLANSITLTPGTLSVDVINDRIIVHWIDCPENEDMQSSTVVIVDKFEDYLKGFVR